MVTDASVLDTRSSSNPPGSGGIEPPHSRVKLFGGSVPFVAEMESAMAVRTYSDGILNRIEPSL